MAVKCLLLLLLVGMSTATFRLQERYSWNVLDWNYPNDYSRQQALASGALIPENALPVGIERWRNKLFVSVPRWRAGIPATLNYIPLDAAYEPSPKLTPYPSWEGNKIGECSEGLTTVYRIKADRCDRLWVLDTGTYGYDPNVTNPCPYSVNIYDLNTDQRIRKYILRPEDIVPTTFIANIAVDIGYSCDDAFAYFSDELGYGLIAYSFKDNKSWRFDHNYFMPDPLLGDFNIAGLNFNWGTEGIFGIALSPIQSDGYRTLYFSPLASHTEFSVSTRILRNETSATNGNYRDFQIVGTRSYDSHCTAKVMDDSGVQLFSLIDQNAIGCWNSALQYKPQNLAVIDRDDVALVFPSDVKIDEEKNVWVMSERMPVFLEAELDYSDINFRIFTAPLDVLLQGTVCEPLSQQSRRFPNQKAARPFYDNRLNSNLQNVPNLQNYQNLQGPNAIQIPQNTLGPVLFGNIPNLQYPQNNPQNLQNLQYAQNYPNQLRGQIMNTNVNPQNPPSPQTFANPQNFPQLQNIPNLPNPQNLQNQQYAQNFPNRQNLKTFANPQSPRNFGNPINSQRLYLSTGAPQLQSAIPPLAQQGYRPKVTSYINISKQPGIPYMVSTPQSTGVTLAPNPAEWWSRSSYKVHEPTS